MNRVLLAILVSVTAWLFVACAAETGAPGNDQQPSSSPRPEPTVPPGAQAAVAAAKKDLAEKTGRTVEQLALISVEEVDWRDTSLGCPEPGMFYAQVITPGYRIILFDGSREHEYHSDKRGRVVACTGGR